jgi:hypothetical protein
VALLKVGTVELEKQPLLENDSETTFVSRQRPQTNRYQRQQSTRNIAGTTGNGVFYGGPEPMGYKEDNWSIWKGAAIQSTKAGEWTLLEAVTRQLLMQTLRAGRDSVRASDLLSVLILAMAL